MKVESVFDICRQQDEEKVQLTKVTGIPQSIAGTYTGGRLIRSTSLQPILMKELSRSYTHRLFQEELRAEVFVRRRTNYHIRMEEWFMGSGADPPAEDEEEDKPNEPENEKDDYEFEPAKLDIPYKYPTLPRMKEAPQLIEEDTIAPVDSQPGVESAPPPMESQPDGSVVPTTPTKRHGVWCRLKRSFSKRGKKGDGKKGSKRKKRDEDNKDAQKEVDADAKVADAKVDDVVVSAQPKIASEANNVEDIGMESAPAKIVGSKEDDSHVVDEKDDSAVARNVVLVDTVTVTKSSVAQANVEEATAPDDERRASFVGPTIDELDKLIDQTLADIPQMDDERKVVEVKPVTLESLPATLESEPPEVQDDDKPLLLESPIITAEEPDETQPDDVPMDEEVASPTPEDLLYNIPDDELESHPTETITITKTVVETVTTGREAGDEETLPSDVTKSVTTTTVSKVVSGDAASNDMSLADDMMEEFKEILGKKSDECKTDEEKMADKMEGSESAAAS